MAKKQIEVDEEKIQSTQIVVTVKTLSVIVGIILTGLTTLFGILSSKISDVDSKIDKLDQVKVIPIGDMTHDLDKKVYYLLMRTNSRQDGHTDGNAPTSNTPPPR